MIWHSTPSKSHTRLDPHPHPHPPQIPMHSVDELFTFIVKDKLLLFLVKKICGKLENLIDRLSTLLSLYLLGAKVMGATR